MSISLSQAPYAHPVAPQCQAAGASSNGYMTSALYNKLDGIEPEANNYVFPSMAAGNYPALPLCETSQDITESWAAVGGDWSGFVSFRGGVCRVKFTVTRTSAISISTRVCINGVEVSGTNVSCAVTTNYTYDIPFSANDEITIECIRVGGIVGGNHVENISFNCSNPLR